MARGTKTPPPEDYEETIIDVDVSEEMRGSFLEYAYSVIYSRAIPDARDGLKPVQRRILFQMHEMGLRPDRAHVKCGRVVGDVMGKLHPHGDGAIYDTLVRMAQPWAMRVPLVDGHGNFGSLDAGPAAYRYTECRMAEPAMLLTGSLDENVVDMVPNYDGQFQQPDVLPAAFPNLLVNGASGIAVGMATNMAPHNLGEVIDATRHLIANPDASLDDLMRFVPGPDLPSGGRIVGLDGIRDAYETGRGAFKTRATARIENITARRKGIVITELPYMVGPERVRERIVDLVRNKKLGGVADVVDYTDRNTSLRLVIELKSGFVPEAVLEELYRLTPLEDSFSMNNVALVDGQPRTLGLKELLEVFIKHRLDVVRRRSEFRRTKAADRLHLVDGLLVALLDIDEVIAVIRSSDDATAARERLMEIFDLSEIQARYILDTPLRRLTKYDRLELDKEADELRRTISELTALLDDESLMRQAVSAELADVAAAHATPRRTVLLEDSGTPSPRLPATALEVTDDPCQVLLSSTGLLARTAGDEPPVPGEKRAKHDLVVSAVGATARGEIGLVTTAGRVIRLSVLDLPALPPTASPTLAGGAPISEFVELEAAERVLCLADFSPDSPGLALGTEYGVVKRVVPEYPSNRDSWDVIRLDDDRVVGAVQLRTGEEDLVFVSSDAQLLHFSASVVRPQGRSGGGVAGIKLSPDARVTFFGAIDPAQDATVVTVSGSSSALPGTQAGNVKVTPYSEYPAKGRATGGVRCHRFLKGEDTLLLAWAGHAPARASAASGVPIDLPPPGRRDGSGTPAAQPIAAVGTHLTGD
ncbi:DNA topoisomerase IV subunit A [Phytoactinopolyspora alkaliphila]|uniref:DNA topoisomerase (ATP-hydrolyzing) n=1 Tax=Phytoactinopolyspora alkaliphila TaxID=1783498 RepID=A0A6N9YRE2_9ACTN|nr:DNA topoisomerase (ATP-hydrolyzing) [Phytoactinopolyspora alkaliphila]NED97552.1 DNA topoisomerase IV subunit A [Phytoactinopolyspora alkaliphila]